MEGARVPFWKSLLTEDDANTIPCPARIGWAVGIISFLGLSIAHVVVNKAAFDFQGFGLGFAAINAAGGVALYLKGKSGQ